MLVCKKGLTVQPLNCFQGYYLGTFDPEEGPRCRLSDNYVKSLSQVTELNTNRCCVEENLFCSGGDCEIHEVLDFVKEV